MSEKQSREIKQPFQKGRRAFLSESFKLFKLFWCSKERTRAFLLLGVVTFLLAAFTALEGVTTYWQRGIYDALQNYNLKTFIWMLQLFVPLASTLIVLFICKHFFQVLLQVRWRQFLTQQFTQKWLTDKRYYLLQFTMQETDNPDQRLAEDLEHVTSSGLSLFVSFVGALLTLLVFFGILWNISGPFIFNLWGITVHIPGYLVFAAFFYALWGTLLTKRIMRPFSPLYIALERCEGSFRYALARVREHGESIAFYHGENSEKSALKNLFQNVATAALTIARKMIGVNLWLSFYGQLAIVLPFLLMAPRYFKEHLAIGILIQVASSFGSVQGAFSVIVNNYPALIALKASVLRILAFDAAMEKISRRHCLIKRTEVKKEKIGLQNLLLQTPSGQTILDIPRKTFDAGQSALIKGPSGAGKSTLLRALAGMWTFGSGSIEMPKARTFFIPQKPYIPLGTLRDALVYPQKSKNFKDAALYDVLDACGLPHLQGRLDDYGFWMQILSGGETQRLAFARLLLWKPAWVFLDEATSALDSKMEARMYKLVKERLPDATLLSVGHKPTLDAFHTQIWNLGTSAPKK